MPDFISIGQSKTDGSDRPMLAIERFSNRPMFVIDWW